MQRRWGAPLACAALVLSTACQPALVPLASTLAPAPVLATTADAWPDHAYLRSRRLMVPVAGASVLDVDDTFDHGRSGERIHRAVDILAPRGTPVLAADAGRVVSVKSNALGGLTVYVTDPAGKLAYYYAHLDRYAPGLAEGQTVRQGDVLGYVGTTGNAPPNVPHLHFQVLRVTNRARYWDGQPLDPRPYFTWDGGVAGELP
jgi:peptidoglycan LD-endopeptidase LytH